MISTLHVILAPSFLSLPLRPPRVAKHTVELWEEDCRPAVLPRCNQKYDDAFRLIHMITVDTRYGRTGKAVPNQQHTRARGNKLHLLVTLRVACYRLILDALRHGITRLTNQRLTVGGSDLRADWKQNYR